MITDLTKADSDFYRSYFDKDRACHESEFLQAINPDVIRAFYRGKSVKDSRFLRTGYGMNEDQHILMLSMIFASANTILPNLMYQYPQAIVTALRPEGNKTPVVPIEDSAALMSALLKYYAKCNDKKATCQEAVMNAYWFGLGWSKIGYSLPSEPTEQIAEEPETAKPFNFMDMMKPPKESIPNPLQSKERMEFIDEEGLFNSSESPLNIYLDHKADLKNGKVRTHRVPRTLYELMNFGSYEKEVLDEIYTKFKHSRGSRFDSRDIDLTLNEQHIKQRNGVWIHSWVDEFDKPLQYEKSTLATNHFQIIPLVFTIEPGVRYPISHMKIAVQVQDKIDKMASLFYEQVSRARNMLFINESDLAKGTLAAIEANKLGGIALTNKSINQGTFANAQSPAVQNDLPTLINLASQNLIQNMGADEQLVAGKSKNKTLGQDELARVGTKVRESGMQDKVKDFLIQGVEQEAQLLMQYSEAQLQLDITGEDYADPIIAQEFTRKQASFMTNENPIAVKRFIEGVKYEFDFNMEDGVRPDSDKIMNDIERVIAFTSNPIIENAINQDGMIVKTGSLAKEWLTQVKSLGNPMKYLGKIDSMQLAAIQTRKMLMNQGGQMGQPPKPGEPKGADMAGKPESSPEPKSSEAAKL